MRAIGAILAGLVLCGAAGAQPPPASAGAGSPVDYAQAASWICLPGAAAQGMADGTCAGDLDAMAVDAAGTRTRAPFVAADDPGIDCFYVYPTASDDPTPLSDLAVDGSEKRVVHLQAARLGAACRLFVPAYRQFTMAALRSSMAGDKDAVTRIQDVPYGDIRAAWRSYLARDNHRRGVVLIGHSQGAIILKRLIAEEIDGKPVQARLVGAYLAGNPDLGSRSFRAIRPCGAIAQTGCLVAWSSYLESYAGDRAFGATHEGTALCVNPAAPGGGRAPLKAVLNRPGLAPASDPPFVEATGQLSAECVDDGKGAVLRVRIEPGTYAPLLTLALANVSRLPSWGLHPLDINLVQGSMIDMIRAQGAAWIKAGH